MKDRYIGITQPLNIISRAYANLDAKYGPYNSIENALENIPMSLRVQGLTVGIIIDNEIKEYWFSKGIENNNLILKTNPGVDLFEELENKVDKEPNAFLMTTTDKSLLYSLRDKKPIVINGFWAFWDEQLQEYVESDFSAVGDEGHSPYINPETGTWFEWNPDINDYHDTGIKAKGEDGKDAVGENGIPGQIPIKKEWKINDLHRNNDEIVDYIYYRDKENVENSKWVKLKNKGDVQNTSATPSGTLYEEITWLKELAVNVLLAEEANVAGFIFKNDILFSQKGRVNGVEVDYDGQPNFTPNIVLDGKQGESKLINAEISGKLTIPFVIKDGIGNTVLNLEDSFNITTHSYTGNTTIYLPTDKKYNGVTCNIYNGGLTTNEGSIQVKVEGDIDFLGFKPGSTNLSIDIDKKMVGTFICIETLEGNISWACLNYSDLIRETV